MFELANFVLLALFAAAAVDLALALRAAAPGSGRARRALGSLWGGEHLLFGSWGAGARLSAGGWAFTVGLAAYEVSVAFCNSLIRMEWQWTQDLLAPALEWLTFGCFAFKILLGTRYTWRSLGVAGALYFIARWVHFNSHNIFFIGIVFALLAAKDIPWRRSLRAFLAAGAVCMVLVYGLQRAGITRTDYYWSGSEIYWEDSLKGLGYGHPNTFGGLLFGLILAWALLREGRLRWLDIGLIAGAGLFLHFGPGSTSPALCALLLAALLAAGKLCPAAFSSRAARAGGPVLVGAAAAFSYLLPLRLVKTGPWWSDFGPEWLSRLSALLNGRLVMAWTAYRVYEIKIAGQMFDFTWPVLDNGFLYGLYMFGPVMTALMMVLLAAALWGYARTERFVPLACLMAVLAYAYMEIQVFHLTSDPAALLLAGAVFALPPEKWPGAET